MGARYVCSAGIAGADLRAELGAFDLVVEATGDAEAMVGTLGLLDRNGVACLFGLDPRPGTVALERRLLGVDFLLGNRAVFASVNAHPQDWAAAVAQLAELVRRRPEAAEGLVGLRVTPDRFEDAFAFTGVKATLRFA